VRGTTPSPPRHSRELVYTLTVQSPSFTYTNSLGECRQYHMNLSNHNLSGSPSFTIVTEKGDDGRFTAVCQSLPDIPAVTESDEIDAIRAMRRQLEVYVMTGGQRSK
jgi:hypothetical protein